VEQGAYHIRSTLPVTVYQFSPLDYTDGDIMFSFTNDASLLLPVNALTGTYVIPSWPYFMYADNPYPSMMTIVATADETEVTVNPRATAGGGDLGVFPANVETTVTLQAGDALELLSGVGDLTGSLVEADKPIAIIAGHYATNIPTSSGSQDHLEEQVFPFETLSNSYVVAAPAVPALPDGKEQFIRVIAAQDDTTITYEPDIPSADTYLADVGSFVEIPQHVGDHLITADKKVLVVQYMESGYAGLPSEVDPIGDPAMAQAVATDQYRSSYLFHAPANYETNYVNIVAPGGAEVQLDGATVSGFVPVGDSGWDVARVELDNSGDGNHFAESDEPFGVSVYGYGWCTSYWYPGGLDLDEIPIE
ncbi:MAG: IgGFc-binding protein, partial [Deltaproteobacteria bacterium]|nr:IgGFc-binding protein [Deltaproteobacteria bacterium]